MSSLLGKELMDCPFCGKQVSIAYENGQPNGVIHLLPMCSRFEQLGPSEFLAACRRKMERLTS